MQLSLEWGMMAMHCLLCPNRFIIRGK